MSLKQTNKQLNTMQDHWVVQIRLNIWAASFIKDHPVFFVGKKSKYTNNETCGAIGLPFGTKEPPTA